MASMIKAKINLDGPDGNFFAVMAITVKTLKAAGRCDLIDKYRNEVMGGDYNNLLKVTRNYVDID